MTPLIYCKVYALLAEDRFIHIAFSYKIGFPYTLFLYHLFLLHGSLIKQNLVMYIWFGMTVSHTDEMSSMQYLKGSFIYKLIYKIKLSTV